MATIVEDMDAFLMEHRRCGELDAGIEGEWVWMTCTCGATLARPAGPDSGPVAGPA